MSITGLECGVSLMKCFIAIRSYVIKNSHVTRLNVAANLNHFPCILSRGYDLTSLDDFAAEVYDFYVH